MDVVTPILILFVGLVAAGLNLAVTPLVRMAAIRCGFVDQPDRHRKLHQQAVSLGGGLAIGIVVWATIAMTAVCETSVLDLMAVKPQELVGLVVASCLIVLLGLLDDRFGLRGRHKLQGQIAVAAVLINFGYEIRGITLFGIHIDLGLLSVPISLGWLLLATNALNLIDGIDGLASTVGLILCVTMASLAFLNGHPIDAVLLAAMGGAIAGFLRYNFPPAQIFLGDAGSMLIGLWVGAISLHATLKGPAMVGLAAPLAVWTVPLFDTLAAIVRRKLTGRSIYTTDRGHLHHCLEQVAGSTRRTLYLIVLACSTTCLGALTSVRMKSDLFALISAVSVVGVLVVTRSFGYGELQLLTGKLRNVIQTLSPIRGRAATPVPQTVRLQGSRPWDQLWKLLMEFTEEFNLTKLSLDVNIPTCLESYHVTWAKPQNVEPQIQWETTIPLCSGERRLGQLLIGGLHDGYSACRLLGRLFDSLEAFEIKFQEVVDGSFNMSTQLDATVGVVPHGPQPESRAVVGDLAIMTDALGVQ
jgi:UDP-GlcNAc:undecaprenyl-phosphate GlcNAc-1-phosphate transferase